MPPESVIVNTDYTLIPIGVNQIYRGAWPATSSSSKKKLAIINRKDNVMAGVSNGQMRTGNP